jgi:succinate dehydrogenase / fumarate reductase flavoprotein subunit
MEFIQFHPTGMVWPLSVRGLLVTEGVRGDGGVLRNKDGKRFMFEYVPDMFRADTAETEEEADRWYDDRKNARRPPELLPRDEVARAINTEVKEGRATPHGGVYLDIASRLPADVIKKRLPSMYHQFMELAEVDITKEPMEVGPTCHYIMGGVRVDADTAASAVPGLYAAGEVAGGMQGANRLGGNSLSDLLVFGMRAGLAAAEYARGLDEEATVPEEHADAIARWALSPFERSDGESPYAVHDDLRACMQTLVGIVRTEGELKKAIEEIMALQERADRVAVRGSRVYNPGWHTALDLRSLLTVAECVTLAAIERRESRGAQTRDDYPTTDPDFAKVNVVLRLRGRDLLMEQEPIPVMPGDLKELVEA